MLSSKMKRVAIGSLTAVICGAGQGAFAHTTIKDSSVDEGSRVFTALQIPHGCETGAGEHLPVIAQSCVFPNGNSVIAFRTDTNEPVDLSTIVVDAIPGAGLVGLAPVLIQNNDVFNKLRQRKDASGRVRGFKFTDGSLQTDLLGILPFRIQAPVIQPTSCVKSLKVRVAVGNWCNMRQRGLGRADIWVGRLTRLFNDPRVVSVGFWPTISVNRKSPLDPSCGGGFDVAVEPTDADIDGLLPIREFWPTP
jgi:hypothetical protein